MMAGPFASRIKVAFDLHRGIVREPVWRARSWRGGSAWAEDGCGDWRVRAAVSWAGEGRLRELVNEGRWVSLPDELLSL